MRYACRRASRSLAQAADRDGRVYYCVTAQRDLKRSNHATAGTLWQLVIASGY